MPTEHSFLLKEFSLTTFYHENINLSLSSFDSSPHHGQANDPHLHTHTYTSPFEKIDATWFGRSGHPFSWGCIANVTVRHTCPLAT